MNLNVVIEEGEDGYYVASVPALKKGALKDAEIDLDEFIKSIR
jgi:predicted RNase H-like HicB family nuclease